MTAGDPRLRPSSRSEAPTEGRAEGVSHIGAAASEVPRGHAPRDEQLASAVREGQPAQKVPLRRLLQFVAVGVVAGLLALLVWSMIAGERGSAFVHAIADGERPAAPQFSLRVIWNDAPTWPPQSRRLISNGKLSLKALRGQVVVLNFWASWCVPCKQEAPLLAQEARRWAGKALFLGLDSQDLEGSARHFASRYGMNYVSVADSGNKEYQDYGLTGFPETYIIDRNGRVLAHNVGPVSRGFLSQNIRAAGGYRE